jgi:HAD superfamily hydrolase (TIGR01484 family)
MDIKLIATDMDGTLLSSDKKLTERTVRALTEADQRGIHVVLATGRTFQGLDAYTEILPFVRYYITVNGSYVWDAKTNSALYSATIPIERGIEIISYLKKYETMNDCYIDGQGWIDQRYLDNIHEYIADERSFGWCAIPDRPEGLSWTRPSDGQGDTEGTALFQRS